MNRVNICAAVFAAATFVLGASASAEDITGAPIEESFAAAKSRLNLTSDQEARLAPLMQENADKTRSIMARYGTTPSPEKRAAKYDELAQARRHFREKLTTVLNPEQLMEWDKLRAEALTRAQKERLSE